MAGITSEGNTSSQAIETSEVAMMTPLEEFPILLDKVVSVMVTRPTKSRSKKEKEEEEEILVVEKIEFQRDEYVKFDVYVNAEDKEIRPDYSEYAGSFVNVPHKHIHGKKMKTCLRLGLTDLLEDLKAEDDQTLLVTLVPKSGKSLVSISGLIIQLSS